MKSIATAIAALALSASPAVLAQPYLGQPNGYQTYPGQPATDQGANGWGQSTPYGQPPYQPPYTEDQNQREAQQYDRSEDAYDQKLRQYEHDQRQYDRQLDAYDAQSEAYDASAYPPPPPDARPWAGSYRYSETIPFRDGPWEYADRDGGWYRGHGCRLAAPHGDPDAGRLIPVCPDQDGFYHPAD